MPSEETMNALVLHAVGEARLEKIAKDEGRSL